MSVFFHFDGLNSPIFGRSIFLVVLRHFYNTFIAAFLLTIAAQHAFAQTEQIDSLKNVLSGLQKDDTTKAIVLNQLSFYLAYTSHLESIKYAHQAIHLSARINYTRGLAHAYYNIGYYHRFISEQIDSAIKAFEKAGEYYLHVKDSGRYATCLLQLSGIYGSEIKLQTALEHALKAKDIIEGKSNYANSGLAYELLASIYTEKENFELAKFYYQKALDKYSANQRWGLLTQVKNGLASYYLLVNQPDSALINAKEALSIAQRKNLHGLSTLIAYSQVGESFLKLNEVDSALHYLKKGEAFLDAPDIWPIYQIRLYLNFGRAYAAQKNYARAEYYFFKSLNNNTSTTAKAFKNDTYRELGKLYELKGELKKSIFYYKKHLHYSDSMSSILNKTSLEDIQTLYESEKKSKENEMLKMDLMMEKAMAENRKLQLWLAVMVALLGIVIILVQHRSRVIIRKKNILLSEQNKEIQAQNEEILAQNEEISMQTEQLKMKNDFLEIQNEKLEEINREKDGLMSIVAHDLRAPLNRTKGIAGLLKTRVQHPEDLVFIQKIIHVTDDGLSLIKDILEVNYTQHDTSVTQYRTVNLKTFIEEEVVKQFLEVASKKAIQIFTALEGDIELLTDTSALKRIMENLLSNAIKFSPASSRVFLRTSEVDNLICIGVQDEGPGISSEDQKKMFKKFQRLTARPTGGEHSTGLGLAIVKSLVGKLKGEIIVETDLDAGTEFIVKLPKKIEVSVSKIISIAS